MEIGTVFYLFIIIIIIFSHCTRWWWWYCSILLKVQIHIYMYSKLDITAKVTIPKTVLQSSAGCTLWLKVETVFSFVFFFFFFFSFLSFLWAEWWGFSCIFHLFYTLLLKTQSMFVGLVTAILCGLDHKNDPSWIGVQNTTNIFYGCGNFKFWNQWLSYNWVLISSLVGFQHRSDVDQIPVDVISFFDTVEFEFKVKYS